jgi:Ca-activated chloride channel family protein
VVPTAAASGAGLPLRYQGERALTPAALGTDELLTVKIRYKAPDGDVSALLSYPVPDRTTPFAQASTDTRWAAAVAGYGMLLRDSPHKGTLGWSWVRATAREALGADIGGYRAELLGLVEKARRIAG